MYVRMICKKVLNIFLMAKSKQCLDENLDSDYGNVYFLINDMTINSIKYLLLKALKCINA